MTFEAVALTPVPAAGNGNDAASGANTAALPQGPLRPRPGVLGARALDAMALYDPRSERYLTLNPVATMIWQGLELAELPEVIAERIAATYKVPLTQVQGDVATQLLSWLSAGLVEFGAVATASSPADAILATGGRIASASSRSAVGIPSFATRLLTIAMVKRSLRRRRFEGTLAWIRAQVASMSASEDVSIEQVRALEYAVAMAAAFYPGRAKCLEQSLALYLLARRQGVAVRYCQGMQLYPFEAHAWISYRCEVINDVPEHVRHFTTFPDQLP